MQIKSNHDATESVFPVLAGYKIQGAMVAESQSKECPWREASNPRKLMVGVRQ